MPSGGYSNGNIVWGFPRSYITKTIAGIDNQNTLSQPVVTHDYLYQIYDGETSSVASGAVFQPPRYNDTGLFKSDITVNSGVAVLTVEGRISDDDLWTSITTASGSSNTEESFATLTSIDLLPNMRVNLSASGTVEVSAWLLEND
ncbi:MAG: hypothetical protein WC942_01765 [Clostridia bacterium]